MRRDGEAADIVDRLAEWHWWGGHLLEEVKSTEEMYQSDPDHWTRYLGGSEESARDKLFEDHRAKLTCPRYSYHLQS